MLKIVRKNFNEMGHQVDFELEDGSLLFTENWNGELYYDTANEFKSIYFWELNNMDLQEIEENSEKWIQAMTIVGFEKN